MEIQNPRTLYVLDAELGTLLDEIEEAGGEITDDIETRLDALELAKTQKVEGVVKYIQHLKSMQNAVKEEKQRLGEVQKRYEKRAESLTNYLLYHTGSDWKQETPIGRISWRRSDRVAMIEGVEVPVEYTRVKAVVNPDKEKMKAELKEGKSLEFAKLEENFSLQVR